MSDKAGIFVSIGCMIHCIFFPLLPAIFPATGFIINHGPVVHLAIVIIIWTIAVMTFIPGYNKHERRMPEVVASVGITILTIMTVIEVTGHESKIIVIFTIIGSLTIAYAHYLNHKYLCSCEQDGVHKCH